MVRWDVDFAHSVCWLDVLIGRVRFPRTEGILRGLCFYAFEYCSGIENRILVLRGSAFHLQVFYFGPHLFLICTYKPSDAATSI